MTNAAAWVRIEVVRWIEGEPQPGVVECVLIDRSGKRWPFLEKAIVNPKANGSGSAYPQAGHIECQIIRRGVDGAGAYVEIEADQRWMDDPADWEARRFIVTPEIVEGH